MVQVEHLDPLGDQQLPGAVDAGPNLVLGQVDREILERVTNEHAAVALCDEVHQAIGLGGDVERERSFPEARSTETARHGRRV